MSHLIPVLEKDRFGVFLPVSQVQGDELSGRATCLRHVLRMVPFPALKEKKKKKERTQKTQVGKQEAHRRCQTCS